MTTYGFRLHTFVAHQGRRRAALPFGEQPVLDGAQMLHNQLRAIADRVFVKDATYKAGASIDDIEEARRLPARTPVLRVDDVARKGNRVDAEVSYGRLGDFLFAMAADGGPDYPLERSAAARRYRVMLHVPAAGDRGVMVSEVAGRTFVGDMLLKRLSVEACNRAAAREDEDGWVRWTSQVLVDEARVDEVVENGSVEGLRLKRSAVDAAGQRTSRPIALTQTGVRPEDRAGISTMVKRWLHGRSGRQSTNLDRELKAMVALVDADVSKVDFTDGVLTFNENGKTQSIGPTTLERILVYPLGEERPSFDVLHEAASERLRPLLQALRIPIDLR